MNEQGEKELLAVLREISDSLKKIASYSDPYFKQKSGGLPRPIRKSAGSVLSTKT